MSMAKNRSLAESERRLARWMLEHGTPEAATYFEQLDNAEVTPWRCPCGCATISFQIRGMPEAPPGVHILGHFIFGAGDGLSGVFIFSSDGKLSGLEVYDLSGSSEAPKELPAPEMLRPFPDSNIHRGQREKR